MRPGFAGVPDLPSSQGDLEKAEGRQPIPMMDRTKAHELPASQVLTAIPSFRVATQIALPTGTQVEQ